MSLIVHTARVSSRDPDAFNVTRKSGGDKGAPFAPSWTLLRRGLDDRAKAIGQAAAIVRACEEATGGHLADEDRAKGRAMLETQAWSRYAGDYHAEMQRSYREHRAAWDALLARPRVVLVCYCTDPDRCHRSLLAGYLGKLGADVQGELGLDDAVAACRAIAGAGKLTARDIADACGETGAELCVVWERLNALGVISMPYAVATARGLRSALRAARAM